ncbi:MAG: hypothetical protein WBD22_11285 [Pyrinomonadaceae bacterium]
MDNEIIEDDAIAESSKTTEFTVPDEPPPPAGKWVMPKPVFQRSSGYVPTDFGRRPDTVETPIVEDEAPDEQPAVDDPASLHETDPQEDKVPELAPAFADDDNDPDAPAIEESAASDSNSTQSSNSGEVNFDPTESHATAVYAPEKQGFNVTFLAVVVLVMLALGVLALAAVYFLYFYPTVAAPPPY